MASPYDNIPDEVKRAAAENADAEPKKAASSFGKATQKAATEEHPQRRIFKKKRAGVVLSREEVKAIRIGRKKLRKEMRARGIRSKREFELVAGSLGLYFDKRNWGILAWLWGHWLGALIASMLALLGVLMLFSLVQQMRGHFTINLSDGMFREGFSLSETADFKNPSTHLFAVPAEDVPCISITQLPLTLDEIDGEHNDSYFAYTFYLRNEGKNTIDFTWSLDINEETQHVSDAVWVILFCDGDMRLYAKANALSGQPEALPSFDETQKGYITLPIRQLAGDADQFRVVATVGQITYWRVVPYPFASDTCVANGLVTEVAPMEVHKYTVVLWIEGDDEEATEDKVGGHLGAEMNFVLKSEKNDEGAGGTGDADTFGNRWKKFWDGVWNGLRYE